MKKQFVNLLVLFFLFQNLMSQDPRIILTPERITDLKAKISVAGTHHNELFKAIRTRVNKNDVYEYGTFSSMNYARSFYAVECALLYRLTDSSYYAQKAYNLLEEMYTSGEAGTPTIPELGSYPPSPQAGSKALTYAFPSVAYGLCYDWARNDWSQAQKDYVIDSIKAGLDDWEALFRWELYNMPTSNWVSVCRGAEILMMLGAGEETNRPDRYEGIKDSI